jgi:hypothetical protein
LLVQWLPFMILIINRYNNEKIEIMARFTYTKTVESYSFVPPRMISEKEYNSLKLQVLQNPSEPLIDEMQARNSHERLLQFLYLGVFLFAIGLIGMFANKEPTWWGCILLLVSVFGFIHPVINEGQLESSRNRVRAHDEKIMYYRNLKKNIAKTNSYLEFLSK